MAGKNESKKTPGAGVDLGDLDDLEGFGDFSIGSLIDGGGVKNDVPAAPTGKPLELNLSDVEEDPDQPRTEFNQTELDDMAQSIKVHGVKTPVSVRPHPSKPGKWMLNFGARRYRGSILAGRKTIPAFVDEAHDEYAQMIENIQRDDLKPMEVAAFIKKRMELGDKKGAIAERLGKPNSYISKHSALFDIPDTVRAAYDKGTCRDIEALYALIKNYGDYQPEIDEICAGDEVLSQQSVLAMLKKLKEADKEPEAPVPDNIRQEVQETIQFVSPGIGGDGNEATEQHETPEIVDNSHTTPEIQVVPEAPAPETKPPKEEDPTKLRKAIVLIAHDERPARLVLDRRAANGLAWIKYDDDGHEIEIDIRQAQLVAIVEA